ncbi:hypothetical protein TIFTF001_011940 [Ficus carica]|uniref:NAC domain-containing protein n=1 Tax=Ficus carica TaxID=3494 RepID=A0AA88D184_FICCA|nr:hypothetical protein TIFTF001_011940 [Ficus carica]
MRTKTELPPGMAVGYRFYPTDEELIRDYLRPKLLENGSGVDHVIAEVDFCNFEPWDLPPKSKIKSRDPMWLFFSRTYVLCRLKKKPSQEPKTPNRGEGKSSGAIASDIEKPVKPTAISSAHGHEEVNHESLLTGARDLEEHPEETVNRLIANPDANYYGDMTYCAFDDCSPQTSWKRAYFEDGVAGSDTDTEGVDGRPDYTKSYPTKNTIRGIKKPFEKSCPRKASKLGYLQKNLLRIRPGKPSRHPKKTSKSGYLKGILRSHQIQDISKVS